MSNVATSLKIYCIFTNVDYVERSIIKPQKCSSLQLCRDTDLKMLSLLFKQVYDTNPPACDLQSVCLCEGPCSFSNDSQSS